MEIFFNNIFNRKKTEKREQKEQAKLNILVLDDSEDQLYGQHLDLNFNNNNKELPTRSETVNNLRGLIEKARNEEVDVILIAPPSTIGEDLFKEIVKMRNDATVKKQPIILIMTSDENKSEVEKIQKYASDVIELLPIIHYEEISNRMHSIPEMLGHIEDQYGDKMMKNKISFYKEYKDKLVERSDFTADTKKELEILEEIFEKNGAKKILDAGGGEGRIAIPLAEKGYEVTNLDSSEDLILRMKEKQTKASGIAGDLKKMPIEKESQDAITFNWHIFCDILGVKGKKQTLEEAKQVLKDGGIIVLDIPDREGGSYQKDGVYVQNPGGENIFIGYTPSEEEMKKYLEEAGFKNIEMKKWETKTDFKKITFVGKKINVDKDV